MIIRNYNSISFQDDRGSNNIYFEDEASGICFKESHSKSRVFRGLHIQLPPNTQEKYISVSKGRIKDYVLCLDFKNKDFGKIKEFEITPNEGFFKIPNFCAHGYYAIEDSIFSYICCGKYSEKDEITILMDESFYKDKTVSKKDLSGMSLKKALEVFGNIEWDKAK